MAERPFDVFLAHNSQDKPLIRQLYSELKDRGIKPWLDEEEVTPGTSFQDQIQQAIAEVKTAAICIGQVGLGKWQALELKTLISQCVERNIPVIPVLLPGVTEIPENLLFLNEFHAVTFPDGMEDEQAYYRLEWGITGRKPLPMMKKILSLGVNGSAKRDYDNSPDRILDWTEYYNFATQPRELASPEIWQQVLLPELQEVRDQLAQGRRDLTLDLRGMIPLSGAFVIGAVFQETRGFILQVEQFTGSPSLWKSSETPSNLKFRVVQECGHAGQDLCVALAITRSSWPQIQKLYQNPAYGINAVIYLEPDTDAGASDRALTSNADAVAMVQDTKRLIDHYRQVYQADRLHLVFACPMGFAALLGHRLRAVGEIVTYEFTNSSDQPYVPSVRFNPG